MSRANLYPIGLKQASKLAVLSFVFIFLAQPVFSNGSTETDEKAEKEDPDFIVDTSSIGKVDNGYVRSEQFLELGDPTSGALTLEGEKTLKSGDLDRAIMVLQRSVEMAPMDMQCRILYAQALEKKISKQKQKDPHLFNYLIKQWLFVYKQGDFYDETMEGMAHLNNLTHTLPKRFENDKKYLARVLIPEDGSVKVALKALEENGAPTKKKKKDSEDGFDDK